MVGRYLKTAVRGDNASYSFVGLWNYLVNSSPYPPCAHHKKNEMKEENLTSWEVSRELKKYGMSEKSENIVFTVDTISSEINEREYYAKSEENLADCPVSSTFSAYSVNELKKFIEKLDISPDNLGKAVIFMLKNSEELQ